MSLNPIGLGRDALLEKLRKRVELQQGDAEDVFLLEVRVDLFLEIARGKKFIRMSKDSYFRQLRVQAGKDILKCPGEITHSRTAQISLMSKKVSLYLDEAKEDIRGCIERLRPGIQGMGISHESCRVLRDFINREIPFFTVGMGHNFMAEPYFMFCFQGRDMFGGD